jgi:hypothetical protein
LHCAPNGRKGQFEELGAKVSYSDPGRSLAIAASAAVSHALGPRRAALLCHASALRA